MNQKLDHLVTLFTEQNAAIQETQRTNDQLRKKVSALLAEVAGISSIFIKDVSDEPEA